MVTDVPIPKKSKVWDNVQEAIKDVKSGDVILSGGTHIPSRVWWIRMLSSLECRLRIVWYPRDVDQGVGEEARGQEPDRRLEQCWS